MLSSSLLREQHPTSPRKIAMIEMVSSRQTQPMTQITLSEAQQRLPEIISGLQPGEEVQIIQDDLPIARLVIDGLQSIEGHRLTQRPPRSLGQYEGKFIVPDNFNDPLPDDVLEGFLNPADLH
jgi:antitoxin (DNA-binding transcriptional repressor) of toxin-antitoxin stability system